MPPRWTRQILSFGNRELTTDHPSALNAPDFRRLRTTLNSGRASRRRAMTMNTPANGRVKKIENEPLEIYSDCLSAGSASGPSTMARTAGAIG